MDSRPIHFAEHRRPGGGEAVACAGWLCAPNFRLNPNTRMKEIKEYVPYYELVMPPMITDNDILMLSVKVRGSGDYLPPYAGNLDIINCAAIKILENL